MRIYQVNTPNGLRLVEAATKTQAINHCVSTDYTAEPIGSSELFAAIQAGGKVEKVTVAKKSAPQEPSGSPSPQASSAVPTSTSLTATPAIAGTITPATPASVASHSHTGAMHSSASAPTQAAIAPAPAPAVPQSASAAPAAKAWAPPAPGVNPVLAEQQRINPDAAAAAGAPAAPIITRPAAPALEQAPSTWQDRQ